MLYFAYGSNLLPAQMARRCPGARAAGGARLADWQLILTTRGSANIVRRPGGAVYGGLWHFQPHHIALMDRWEGVAHGAYRRLWVRVAVDDDTVRTALTYVGGRTYAGTGRANYILGNMLPGAHAFDLPAGYLAEIESWLPRTPIAAARRYIGRRTF